MMAEMKVWVLLGVASGMAAVIGFVIKVVTGEVLKRLDDIVNELKQLTAITAEHKGQIDNLQEQADAIRQRLHNHSSRIRKIEMQLIKQS